jgi:hypothetical protein
VSQVTLTKSEAELARAVGEGKMIVGVREALEVYWHLWRLGYRPGVPLTFWMRQRAKKKGPRRVPKVSAMAPQYNPEQEGEGGVNHRNAPSTMSNISRQ